MLGTLSASSTSPVARAFGISLTFLTLLSMILRLHPLNAEFRASRPSKDPKPEFHIVISHYEKDPYGMRIWLDQLRSVPHLQSLGIKVILYAKKEEVDIEEVKNATAADVITQLPNIGRESETYLQHILSIYDDPPAYTLFTQEGPVGIEKNTGDFDAEHMSMINYRFKNTTQFMDFGDLNTHWCECGHCQFAWCPLYQPLYAMMNGEVCHTVKDEKGQLSTSNGQFIVSRQRILSRSRHIYQYLEELISAPDGHWIHDETEPAMAAENFQTGTPSNPLFGHTLERMWATIFGCTHLGIDGCEIGFAAEVSPI